MYQDLQKRGIMYKKFQDIKFVDENDNLLFLTRQVQIESIDFSKSSIISIQIKLFSLIPGLVNPQSQYIFLPKLKGCKLIID